jgi:hypothetical protein
VASHQTGRSLVASMNTMDWMTSWRALTAGQRAADQYAPVLFGEASPWPVCTNLATTSPSTG